MNETNVNEKMLKRAEALTDIARWREAIHELNQFLRDSPQHYRALCLASWSYFELDEHKNALDYALKAIESNPQDEWAHRLRASVFRRQGKKRQALKAASEAVRLEPTSTFALYTLILTQIDGKQLNRAKQTADKLLEVAPESFHAHSSLGYVAIERNKFKTAEKHFRRALQINPQSFEAINKVGWTLLQQSYFDYNLVKRKERLRESAELFQRAVQIDPTNKVARTNLKLASQNHLVGLLNHKYSLIVGVVLFVLLRAFPPFSYSDFKQFSKLLTPIHNNPYIFAVNIYFCVLLFLLLKFLAQRSTSIINGTEIKKSFLQKISLRKRFALEIIICVVPILILSLFLPFQNETATKLSPLSWLALLSFAVGLIFFTIRFFRAAKSA